MRVNRYDNPREVRFDDIDMFSPNTQALAQTLTGQQQRYDAFNNSIDAVTLNSLSTDFDKAESIRNMVSGSSDDAANVFVEKGVNAGNRFLNKRMREIKRQFSPGGEAYAIQSSYNAYNDYVKVLEDMLSDGKITADKKRDLETMSRSFYDGVGDGKRGFNTFTGVDAAEDVNITQELMDFFGEFEADKINSGELTPTGNGDYYSNKTRETITREELFNNAMAVADNPKVQAYMQQEVQRNIYIRGMSEKEAFDDVNRMFNDAANTAAEAKSFTRDDYKFFKNHSKIEAIRHRNAINQINHQWLQENKEPELTLTSTIKTTPSTGTNYMEVAATSADLEKGISTMFDNLGSELSPHHRKIFEEKLDQMGYNVYDDDFTPEVFTQLYRNGAFADIEKIHQDGYDIGWDIVKKRADQMMDMMDEKVLADARLAKAQPKLEKVLSPEEYEAYINPPTEALNTAYSYLQTNSKHSEILSELGYNGFVEALTAFSDKGYANIDKIQKTLEKHGVSETLYKDKHLAQVMNEIRSDMNNIEDEGVKGLFNTSRWSGTDDGWVNRLNSANDKMNKMKLDEDTIVNPELEVRFTNIFPIANEVDQLQFQKELNNLVQDPANFQMLANNMEDEEMKNQFMEDVASGKVSMGQAMISMGSYAKNGVPLIMVNYQHSIGEGDDKVVKNSKILIPASRFNAFDEFTNSPENKVLSKVQRAAANGVTEQWVTLPSQGGEYSFYLEPGGQDGMFIRRWVDGQKVMEDKMTIQEGVAHLQNVAVYKDLSQQVGLDEDTISSIYDLGDSIGIDRNNPRKENAWPAFVDKVKNHYGVNLQQLRALYGDELIRAQGTKKFIPLDDPQ